MERFITSPVWVDGEMRNGVIRNARLNPTRLSTAAKMGLAGYRTTRHGELYCIGLEGCGQRTVYMLGPANGDDRQLDFELVYVASRPQLLEKLNAWFAEHDPDVIIGWNVVQFDLRMLQNMPNATVSPYGWGETIANWSGANMASKTAFFSPRPEGESLSMVLTRLNPRSGIFRLFRWKPSRRNCSAKENPLIIPGIVWMRSIAALPG
ncbi:DNA polymerase II [Salmonella enterica subsp. enterica]|nr:DNA polymerase II [Salmonella enterica subsp. enterica]